MVAKTTIAIIHEKTLMDTPRFALSYLRPMAGITILAMEMKPIAREIHLRFPISGAITSHTKPSNNDNARAITNLIPSTFMLFYFSEDKQFVHIGDLGSRSPGFHALFPYQGLLCKKIVTY